MGFFIGWIALDSSSCKAGGGFFVNRTKSGAFFLEGGELLTFSAIGTGRKP